MGDTSDVMEFGLDLPVVRPADVPQLVPSHRVRLRGNPRAFDNALVGLLSGGHGDRLCMLIGPDDVPELERILNGLGGAHVVSIDRV